MKIYNDSRIPTGLGKPSYLDVFEDGYSDGYDAGYRYGKEECSGQDCSDAYHLGLENGYASGTTDGYASGKADGYASGTTDGYQSGYTDGIATCQDCEDAYEEGYTDGYAAGQNDCEGCEGAYHNGFQDGYESGYTEGMETCEDCSGKYQSGYTAGYQSGYTTGYNSGFSAGEATCSGDTPDTGSTPDTGDTPTPDTGDTGNTGYSFGCHTVEVTYNVTSTTIPTRIMKSGEVSSSHSKVYMPDGTEIIKTTGYTFQGLGEQTLIFVYDAENVPYVSTSDGWAGPIVNINVVSYCTGDHHLHFSSVSLDENSTITGLTFSNSANELTTINGPKKCANLVNVVLPTDGSLLILEGFRSVPYTDLVNTTITLPEGLTTIYGFLNSFNNNPPSCNATSIIIPSTITQLGNSEGTLGNFNNCPYLDSITILATRPPVLTNLTSSLGPTDATFPIYVPAEAVNTYKANSYYQHYASRIQAIPNE